MTKSTNLNKFWRWLVCDKQGNVVLAQRPNAPIIAWFVFMIMAAPAHGRLHWWLSLVSSGSLLFWAILELGWGDSRFRRLLGLVVLSMTLIALKHIVHMVVSY